MVDDKLVKAMAAFNVTAHQLMNTTTQFLHQELREYCTSCSRRSVCHQHQFYWLNWGEGECTNSDDVAKTETEKLPL